MRNTLIIIVIIILLALGLKFLSTEDDWICSGGQWVKHGSPSSPMPTSGCGAEKSPVVEKPPVVEHFACSDYCPGPRESYVKMVYQGVEDEAECLKLGGEPYSYTGWMVYKICIAK